MQIRLTDKLVRIIRSVQVGTRAKYSLVNVEKGWVKGGREVREGCILSPTGGATGQDKKNEGRSESQRGLDVNVVL